MFKKAHISIWPILLLCNPGFAQQQHINFTSLTAKDGLLSNTVNAILKDHCGLMWFATDDGLTRFDGTNFTFYRNQPGDTGSLRVNEILSLHEDKAGNLWVGTGGGGLSLYNRKKDAFVHYPGPKPVAGLPVNSVIRGVCSDYLGNIWIAWYVGLYMLDPVCCPNSKLSTPMAFYSIPNRNNNIKTII